MKNWKKTARSKIVNLMACGGVVTSGGVITTNGLILPPATSTCFTNTGVGGGTGPMPTMDDWIRWRKASDALGPMPIGGTGPLNLPTYLIPPMTLSVVCPLTTTVTLPYICANNTAVSAAVGAGIASGPGAITDEQRIDLIQYFAVRFALQNSGPDPQFFTVATLGTTPNVINAYTGCIRYRLYLLLFAAYQTMSAAPGGSPAFPAIPIPTSIFQVPPSQIAAGNTVTGTAGNYPAFQNSDWNPPTINSALQLQTGWNNAASTLLYSIYQDINLFDHIFPDAAGWHLLLNSIGNSEGAPQPTTPVPPWVCTGNGALPVSQGGKPFVNF